MITDIQKITWFNYYPEKISDYPCICCEKEIATHRIKIVNYPNLFPIFNSLVVCQFCLEKDEKFILENLKENKNEKS